MDPVIFFMVLVLHGLPFTLPKPFVDEATCQVEGTAALKAITDHDPAAAPYFWCVKTPLHLSGWDNGGYPTPPRPPQTPDEATDPNPPWFRPGDAPVISPDDAVPTVPIPDGTQLELPARPPLPQQDVDPLGRPAQ